MINILFVCLGNICRSPLAEAIFNKKIRKYNLEKKYHCDSAGTSDYHIGEPPDPRTIEVAHKHETPIEHYGQQFTKELAASFDYLIAMDRSNYNNMIAELGQDPENLYLMRHFDQEAPNTEVPDPYFGGGDGFEHVYQILDRSIENLIRFLKEKT